MPQLPLKIRTGAKPAQKFRIEVDRNSFERIAAALGLYRKEFLESLDRAETDVKAGRVKKLRSLKDLRSDA